MFIEYYFLRIVGVFLRCTHYCIMVYGFNLVRGTSVWSVVRYGTAYAHKVHGFTVFRAETRARNYGTPALYGK